MDKRDLLILGGGVIGLSCAWHLARRRPELRIAVIDRPALGQTASEAAAGMLAPCAEFGEPSPLRELCLASLKRWPAFAREVEAASGLAVDSRPMPALLPALDDAGAARMAQRRESLSGTGVSSRMLSRGELRAEFPALSSEVREALLVEGQGLVNPRKLRAALLSACERLGVDILEGEAVSLRRAPGEAFRFESAEAVFPGGGSRELRFERLLIATGAWSKGVAALAGIDVPTRPVKGQIGRVRAPESLLGGAIIHSEEIYLAPRGGVMFGATMEDAGFDGTVQSETILRLREMAARLVPGVAGAEIVESWAGLRPCLDDGRPALGRWGEAPASNLWLATGHFRNGILLTPATGALLADSLERSLAGDPSEADTIAEAFRPGRLGALAR